jgi:hypothetical protein
VSYVSGGRTGSRELEAGSGERGAGSGQQGAGSREQAAGNWEQGSYVEGSTTEVHRRMGWALHGKWEYGVKLQGLAKRRVTLRKVIVAIRSGAAAGRRKKAACIKAAR